MHKKNHSSLGKSNDDFIAFDYTDKHKAKDKYVSKREAKKLLRQKAGHEATKESGAVSYSPIGVPKRTIKRILNQQTKSSIRPNKSITEPKNIQEDLELGDYEKSY